MICKKILSKIFPYAQFENVFWKFWILLTLEEGRFLILKEYLLLKSSPQDFFIFLFLNMHILKTSSIWRSCLLSIGWMDGLLGFGPWGNWESLGANGPSSGLFIEGNLRAHAFSWTERIFFLNFFLKLKNVNRKSNKHSYDKLRIKT